MVCRALLLAGLLMGPLVCFAESPSQDAERLAFFERKVRPLLSEHCFECHSSKAKTVHGGLRLDDAASIRKGGDSGEVVVAGKPNESLLIETVRYDSDIQMPPKGKLTDREIEVLEEWIRSNAIFPDPTEPVAGASGEVDYESGRQFWAFQPVRVQPLPLIVNTDWPRSRIDAFVLEAMERHGLSPSPAADRVTLIRRLAFDLTGLPPTAQDVDDFVHDDSPDAYRKLVDRYLDSPLYGEKWARWWLDMARYTDRTASWLYQTGQAHLYRDWVAQAFCVDMPYDDFVRRQLATDLMPETGPDDLPALGFLSLSPTYWKELKLPSEIIKVIVADEWEERVDAVSRTFLGLTVACARCHDHKYDPVSSEDYYALAGIFASCRQVERPIIDEASYEPVRLAKQRVGELEAQIENLKKEKPLPQDKITAISEKIAWLARTTPNYDVPLANALSEESLHVVRAGKTPQEGTRLEYRSEPQNLPAFIRGNPNRPGPIVPRRFLTVLSSSPQPYQQGSGRLELAESILGDAAPLAARVLVNRIWLEHFGRGIVATPSNFGQQGSRPTHPQLLDDLAARFIASGWSIKQLHREILLSATWQQASAIQQHSVEADPDNQWLSRMNRRRLKFEEWRDAMLVASGSIDFTRGGPSIDLDHPGNNRRTFYGTVHRRDMSPTLMVHDFPDPTQHSPQRATTVTPLQGLYALNGPLLSEQAYCLTKRLQRMDFANDRDRIAYVYQQLFSRAPSEQELELGRSFLESRGTQGPDERWQQYVHVLFASNEFLFVD